MRYDLKAIQYKAKKGFSGIIEILLLLAILVVNLLPVLWGTVTSVKPLREIAAFPPKLVGFAPSLEHYRKIFNSGYVHSMLNSAFFAGMSIVVGLLFGYIAAYGFQRVKFKMRKLFFYLVIAGIPLSVGSSALLIPNYLYLMRLNLIDKWYTLILLYTAYNLPMAIWILKGAIEAIPHEIEEAASIDGCSKFYTISRMLPRFILPSIASAALFIFIGSWNEFIAAAVMINSPDLRSIQLSIYYYLGFFGQEWGPLTAAATLAIIPILLVFSLLGRLMVSGMTAGAVKE